MGQNNCCVRSNTQQTSSSLNSQHIDSMPRVMRRFSQTQLSIIEQVSTFEPKKNALPVALTHLLLDNCQGLIPSLPRLMQVYSIYGKKGNSSHYFSPKQLKEHFGLIEKVSTGKEFQNGGLSKVFEAELSYLNSTGVLKISDPCWSLILIFKIGKHTHSFSLKKKNRQEYFLHTLYEVTEEELKEEQIKIAKENQLKIDKKIKSSEPIALLKEDKISSTNIGDSSIQANEKKDIQPQLIYSEESIVHDENINWEESLPRQSTRPTYCQKTHNGNALRLRDMSLKGYNCGEILFSPYNMLLEYFDSISEDLFSQLQSEKDPVPQGFMQLIGFVKEIRDSETDYHDLLNPEE